MLKRVLLLCLGFAALALGAVGMALPVLPTTPFVLCAAGCFASSSPALYKKLANTRYFGEYVRNYKNKTGITRKARYTGLIFLWATLGISALFIRRPWVLLVLAGVGIAVTIHILTIRAAKPVAVKPQIMGEKTQ